MPTDILKERFDEIENMAKAAGLKHFDVHFFEVPVSVIAEVASYGLPTRYSHWSFGKFYQHQETQGEMGYSKIYELILNNDPSYAFLDKTNTDTSNLMIAAHCLAHADFFANNANFKRCGETSMIQVAKRHAEMIDEFRKEYGDDEVDEWLDVALALDRHIDVYRGLKREPYPKRHVEYEERLATKWEDVYDRNYDKTNPLVKKSVKGLHIPPHPEKDILWFLSQYCNMEGWQQRIFEIVRRESYYFYPQYRTKVMNEGWACMTGNSFVLTDQGYIRYKDLVEDFSLYQVAVGSNVKSPDLRTPTDSHVTIPKLTCRVMTDKGISFEGAKNHRVIASRPDDNISKDVYLNNLAVGDFIELAIGTDLWNKEEVKCSFDHPKYSRSKPFVLPSVVDINVGKFLGYFLSEGCTVKRGVQITNKNKELIQDFCKVTKRIFGIEPEVTPRAEDPDKYDCILWCSAVVRFLEHLGVNLNHLSKQKQVPDVIMKSPKKVVSAFLSAYFAGDGGCYDANRIVLSTSSSLMAEQIGLLLLNFGIDYSFRENHKKGYDPNYHLVMTSKHNVWLYSKLIGFASVEHKKKCCERILESNTFNIKRGPLFAKVIEISEGFEVLYDITVPEFHHYIAQGATHHNSYWHAELMNQYALGNDNDYGVKIKHPLTPEEHLDFLTLHSGVVRPGEKIPLKVDVKDEQGNISKEWAPWIKKNPSLFSSATRLNPYYVGFRIFRDIKERWDEYYEQGYMENEWGEKIEVSINGSQKIREVMEEEDDVSFLRNYLTDELSEKLHLFSYGNNEKYDDSYDVQEEIQNRYNKSDDGDRSIDGQIIENKTYLVRSKKLDDIINGFAKKMNNYSVPSIVVRRIDEAGLLRLEHTLDDNVNIDIKYAEHVLKYVHKAWGRPVELIRYDKKAGKTWLLAYDGYSFEVNYNDIEWPDNIESEQAPSSW